MQYAYWPSENQVSAFSGWSRVARRYCRIAFGMSRTDAYASASCVIGSTENGLSWAASRAADAAAPAFPARFALSASWTRFAASQGAVSEYTPASRQIT